MVYLSYWNVVDMNAEVLVNQVFRFCALVHCFTPETEWQTALRSVDTNFVLS